MTPREKAVVRAIVQSLRKARHLDMDALATSFVVPPDYASAPPKHRAAMLLEAMADARE